MTLILKHRGRIIAKVDCNDLTSTAPVQFGKLSRSQTLLHYVRKLDVGVKNTLGMSFTWEMVK